MKQCFLILTLVGLKNSVAAIEYGHERSDIFRKLASTKDAVYENEDEIDKLRQKFEDSDKRKDEQIEALKLQIKKLTENFHGVLNILETDFNNTYLKGSIYQVGQYIF